VNEQAEAGGPGFASGNVAKLALRLAAWLRARLAALDADPVLLAFMAGAAVIHLPALGSYFHGDDFVAWTDMVTKPPLRHLWDVYTFSDSNFYWRPLGQTYDQLVYQPFGLNPVAFHAGSLLIFEATLLLLYWFCRGWGLARPVALGAVLIFGFFPNHVVSVMWVTNTSRLMAGLFLLASLCLSQRAATSGRMRDEVFAWLLFAAAALSDETALALAPLPVLFRLAGGQRELLTPTAARALAYGLLAVALVPLQFMFTADDEPRLQDYGLGLHMLGQAWALASQLTLPLNAGEPMSQSFGVMGPVQWAAGAIAIAAGAMLFLAGSARARFLIVWAGLALAPFTLWDVPYTAPRYVYMAGMPFAVLVSWLGCMGVRALAGTPALRRPAYAAGAIAVAVLVVAGSAGHVRRNQGWQETTEPYRVLATGLKEALPEVESHSRIILYYGVWDGFPMWPDAVVRTIYRDATLDAMNVPRQFAEEDAGRRRANDVVVFYNQGQFIVVPGSVASAR
jgi:hypothetical protein